MARTFFGGALLLHWSLFKKMFTPAASSVRSSAT